MPKEATPKPMKPNTKKPAIQRKSKKNRGNDSSEDDAADKTTGHLKKDNNLLLCNWEGSCYDDYQSPKSIPLEDQPNSCQMKDKFNNYKDMYKKVHTKSISMGFGLTNEDQKVQISTVNEKLESMCHVERLGYDPFIFTPDPTFLLTAHLRSVLLLVMSTLAIDVTDYSRKWSSPRISIYRVVG
ncbi:uncharacterized protein VP01_1579g3 [Puccinia sorghi]|uniref:Uncharacterized protein n=1 Tax=Puccinia sorghi TaxID=27349 RepID=A0A0L6VHN9_9BASI|nr:uncharacterized protein VP01_1579g3 [Puccinia sorghi]